jgi:hypothetical protein
MSPIHKDLAAGRWQTLSLSEQMGNIGSEISRALKAKTDGNSPREQAALDRALELFDLTIADPKHRGRLREICRAREVVCDFFYGDDAYGSTEKSLDRYFTQFAMAARR